ncbi:B12-binding domain-containing radical SAM protein [Patescibacteria group bacterium]
MKKILLINPPIYFDSNGKPHAIDVSVPPLGLIYLASYINKKSDTFKAEILDVAVEKINLKEIKQRILDEKYFALGITAMTPQLQGAVELAQRIKKEIDIPTFLGGPHVSSQPSFMQVFECFDYAICNEAEKTLLNSLEDLLVNKPIQKIQIGETIDNLDEIPIWDRNLVNIKKYSKTASLIFSRGCPFDCYFCSRSAISQKIRYRSVDNLIQEIKNYKLKNIDFQDDTFTIDQEKVIELCQKIIQKNLKIKWTCNTRIDLVNEELLKLMSQAGCCQINFGIEAGDEKIRKEIVHKGDFTNIQIKQIIQICHVNKIQVAGYFILGHPTETQIELQETKNMILKYNFDLIGLSLPTPFPGSELYNIAKQAGIINEQKICSFAKKELGQGYAGNYPIYISENLSHKHVFELMKEINRKFYLQPRIIWQRLKTDFTSFEKMKFNFKNLIALIKTGVPVRKIYK